MKKHKWKKASAATMVSLLTISLVNTPVFAAEGSSVTSTQSATNDSQSKSEVQSPNPEDVKFTKEQAIEKLRELFPVLKDAKVDRVELGNSHQYPPPPNQMIWDISWRVDKGNGSYGFSSQVDAINGDLINTSIYQPMDDDNEQYYPPKVSREEALDIALDFLDKAVPSMKDMEFEVNENNFYSDQPLFGPVTYYFNLNPMINGIPDSSHNVSVRLNGDGKITSLYRSPNRVEYPNTEPKISLEKATDKMLTDFDVELSYITKRYSQDNIEVSLGWVPKNNQPYTMLDAVTGEYVNYDGTVASEQSLTLKDVPKTEKQYEPVSLKDEDTITAEEAKKIVLSYVQIPEKKKLVSKTLTDNYLGDENQVWQLIWRDEQGYGFEGEIRATVDAKTGKLLEYQPFRYAPNQPDETDDPDKKLTEKEITDLAFNYINELYPNASQQLKWRTNPNHYPTTKEDKEEVYPFYFQKFRNGLPVERDSIYMTLNNDGEIINYRVNETPNLDEKIKGLEASYSKEDARKKFLDNTEVKLNYRQFRDLENQNEFHTRLVYMRQLKQNLNTSFIINAETGEWESRYNGSQNQQESEQLPIDLDGNWAKEDILTLVKHHVLSVNEEAKIEPNHTITYGDWLNMMAKATNPRFDSYNNTNGDTFKNVSRENKYYQTVIYADERGWLDKDIETIPVDKNLTRDQLANSLVKLLGYDKLANYMGDELSFDDNPSITHKGAVDVISHLGIMNGNHGSFYPNREVTKAEAATVMMRMVYLQGKTDMSIGNRRY